MRDGASHGSLPTSEEENEEPHEIDVGESPSQSRREETKKTLELLFSLGCTNTKSVQAC